MIDLRLPALVAALVTAPSVARAQTCAVERLASPVGAVENEFGWAIDRDGSRILITAAEELAKDPVTGAGWGDDGGCYVVDLLPGGGFTLPERLQWSDSSAYEMGRLGALEGGHIVLGDALFQLSASALYAFTDLGAGFVAEGRVPLPAAPGTAVDGLDFGLEGGRLVVLVHTLSVAGPGTLLHTFERAGGVWTPTSTFDVGLATFGPRRLALDGPYAYVAADTGALRRLVWNGGAWSDGGTTFVAHPGAPFGGTLDAAGGRIVGVGSDGSGGHMLYSFQELGTATLLEVPVPLPASTVAPDTIAIQGDRVAVGSPWEDAKRGRVELLTRFGSSWQHTATLRPAVDEPGELYGQGLELTDDGRILVGAPHAADYGYTDRGYVEVIEPGAACASLMLHPASVSLSGFSTPVDVALVGPASTAGLAYILLAAASTATPGIPLGGVLLPLASDALLAVSIAQANQPPLVDTMGVLDGAGGSGMPRILAQTLGPGMAGLSVEMAWLAFSLSTPPTGFFFASEARPLAFLP